MTRTGRTSNTQRRIQQAAIRLFAEKGSQISISELARAAGVARGTVHNNIESTDQLFQRIAFELGTALLQENFQWLNDLGIEDPATRYALSTRVILHRVHEDPPWGRFLVRFSFNPQCFQDIWLKEGVLPLLDAIREGYFDIPEEQALSAISLLSGAFISAAFLVTEGHLSWRQAGSNTVELTLRALGIPKERALELATMELPAT